MDYPVAKRTTSLRQLFVEAVGLQSSRGRLLVFYVLTLCVFLSRYHWLDHLSLWGDLGIHRAPSIGLTRAYWLLIHGDPVAAWHRNPLIYLVLAIGLPIIIRDCVQVLRQRAKVATVL